MKESSINLKEFADLLSKNSSKEVVIISAGPSLKNIERKKLNQFCENKFVIAVKQSIDLLDRCDLHIFNDDNFQKFNYNKLESAPLRLYVKSGSLYKRVPKNSYDILYKIDRKVSKKELSLAITRNFKGHQDLFLNNLRPFGPGIMFEICIYIPLYFSSDNVHIFGWDIGSLKEDKIERFYQKKGILSFVNGLISNLSLPFYNRLYIHVENLVRLLLYKIGFSLRINIPGITKGEAKFISEATADLYDFYKESNKNVYIFSDISLVSKNFERSFID